MSSKRSRLFHVGPGIRETVRWLRAANFETCDSGDGVSKFKNPGAVDLAEVIDYAHVSIQVAPEQLVNEARRLYEFALDGGRDGPGGAFDFGNCTVGARWGPG